MQAQDAANLIRFRFPGRRIVTTNGCFDILHVGHLRLLEYAKSQGDYLIVGVNSDSSVKRYKPGRPINNEFDRAYLLSRLSCVDYVDVFEEDTPESFLRKVRPEIHVKSKSGYKGIEKDILKEWNGKLVLMDDEEGYSTTNILNKWKSLNT